MSEILVVKLGGTTLADQQQVDVEALGAHPFGFEREMRVDLSPEIA